MAAPVLAALAESTSLFAALGDPTRMSLVLELGERGPSTAASLAATRDISPQAVGKQLLLLGRAGVLVGQRRGREQLWSVNPGALSAASRQLAAASRSWDGALTRLRHFVEDGPVER